LNEKMGHIGDKIDYKKINCNKCYYQGVRDFDAFYFLLEWLDIKAKGLQNLNPKLLFSALSLKDIEMLYECFKAGWEIKECDLI
ncbi:MAG: hypothetical protein KAJ51_13760, partial [Thermoplasmata archaeon]|nr:hypothetical protein [Thermoplasmata archaeon]